MFLHYLHSDLHVRGAGEDVVYCPGNVFRLEAGHAVMDGGHLVRAVRVHGGLELGLDQAWKRENCH